MSLGPHQPIRYYINFYNIKDREQVELKKIKRDMQRDKLRKEITNQRKKQKKKGKENQEVVEKSFHEEFVVDSEAKYSYAYLKYLQDHLKKLSHPPYIFIYHKAKFNQS
jgi:hypothetical protein